MVIFSAWLTHPIPTAGEGVVRFTFYANVEKPKIKALHFANAPEEGEEDPKGNIETNI